MPSRKKAIDIITSSDYLKTAQADAKKYYEETLLPKANEWLRDNEIEVARRPDFHIMMRECFLLGATYGLKMVLLDLDELRHSEKKK